MPDSIANLGTEMSSGSAWKPQGMVARDSAEKMSRILENCGREHKIVFGAGQNCDCGLLSSVSFFQGDLCFSFPPYILQMISQNIPCLNCNNSGSDSARPISFQGSHDYLNTLLNFLLE
jgi:hypothetical protein